MDKSDETVAMARWARAEDSLYVSMVSDPQAFERTVALVGTFLDHLREKVSDIETLVAASQRGSTLIAEISPESLVPWVPAEMALSAACAVRLRELRAEEDRKNRVSILARARLEGQTWARVEVPSLGLHALLTPTTLVHLRTGTAVAATTEMDPDTGATRFIVRGVHVAVETGLIDGIPSSLGPERSATTLAERDAHIADLQHLIEHLDSENHLV